MTGGLAGERGAVGEAVGEAAAGEAVATAGEVAAVAGAGAVTVGTAEPVGGGVAADPAHAASTTVESNANAIAPIFRPIIEYPLPAALPRQERIVLSAKTGRRWRKRRMVATV
jgi:hypothetical protein